jgi:hypothetical protein
MITVPVTLHNTYPIISCYGNSPCSSVVTWIFSPDNKFINMVGSSYYMWKCCLHIHSTCLIKTEIYIVVTVRVYWDRDCSLYGSLIYLWDFHDLLTNTKYLTALNKLKIMSEVAHGNWERFHKLVFDQIWQQS